MKFLFTLILLLIGSLAYANGRVVGRIKSGDTLEIIAKRNIGRVSLKYGDNYKDYAEDIKTWNPLITDWEHPPKNQYIYLDYPYDYYVSGSTWTPSLGVYEEPDEFNQKISLGAFYASSFGSYTEQTSDQSVTSGQNFPVTLGLAFSTTNEEKKHFIVGSVYWAQASKGSVSGNSGTTTGDFSIPGEIGGNLYYQRYLKEYSIALYTGYDFEKLNTYNTDKIITGAPVENVNNNIHYATVGLSKGFTLLNLNMNLKASLSKTIASTTTGTKALSGYKYIIFYTYKPEGRFNFNVFFKHHSLTGPTELSINRIGFTVGMSIF